MTFLIGIDGGGTGCRALLCDRKGHQLGMGQSGAANIMTNFSTAQNNIVEASINALHDARISPHEIQNIDAFLGLAGANVSDLTEQMTKILPFRQCKIETDALIALEGAIGPDDGIVAVIGTGSVFISRHQGQIRTVGGWGFMVSDTGSGAKLGWKLIQETLLAYDSIHQASPLTDKILHDFENNPHRITRFAHKAEPKEFATFAPLIFEYAQKKDPIAHNILREAIHDIEEILEAMIVDDNQKICLLGGLGFQYTPLLNSHLRHRTIQPKGEAVDGAMALAVSHFSKQNDI